MLENRLSVATPAGKCPPGSPEGPLSFRLLVTDPALHRVVSLPQPSPFLSVQLRGAGLKLGLVGGSSTEGVLRFVCKELVSSREQVSAQGLPEKCMTLHTCACLGWGFFFLLPTFFSNSIFSWYF